MLRSTIAIGRLDAIVRSGGATFVLGEGAWGEDDVVLLPVD